MHLTTLLCTHKQFHFHNLTFFHVYSSCCFFKDPISVLPLFCNKDWCMKNANGLNISSSTILSLKYPVEKWKCDQNYRSYISNYNCLIFHVSVFTKPFCRHRRLSSWVNFHLKYVKRRTLYDLFWDCMLRGTTFSEQHHGENSLTLFKVVGN